jgi:hypothetical protein
LKDLSAAILENLRDGRRVGQQAHVHRLGLDARRPMDDFWDNMFEAMRFGCEAQGVISARLMLFATGSPEAIDEAAQMVAEKILAFTHAGIAAERALSAGLGLAVAAERAYSPLRDCVHANSDRLMRAPH